jgi:hypothetical protein
MLLADALPRERRLPLTVGLRAPDARRSPSLTADIPTIVATLLGPLFYRCWFSREPIDDAFVAAIIGRGLAPGLPHAVQSPG